MGHSLLNTLLWTLNFSRRGLVKSMRIQWIPFGFLFCFFLLVCSPLKASALTDRIIASQNLSDGETLVSDKGSFELGLFSPGATKNRYLGIWYKNIPIRTVVWVANRENPIKDLSGRLIINSTGSLVLSNGTNDVVWSTSSPKVPENPILELLDSGNLVLRDSKDGNSGTYFWQSFDYPCDTLLPGMKMGWDLRTGLRWLLSSWKNHDDPSPGELNNGIELGKYPQEVIQRGSKKYYRDGPWNGLHFSGSPDLTLNPLFGFEFVYNQDEVYYMYWLKNKSIITRLVLNETTSSRQRYVWVEAEQSWKLYASVPRDYCDNYGLCGVNGMCVMSSSPVCQCLEGFRPKSLESWNSMDWSRGCEPHKPLDCQSKHDFMKFSGLKVPDTSNSWVNTIMNLKECREMCLKNCSCLAYTNSNISGRGSGCVLWFGDLLDIKLLSDGGQDLFIKIPASDGGKMTLVKITVVMASITILAGVLLLSYYIYKKKKKAKGMTEHISEGPGEDLDLPLITLATIEHATSNFSENKKLGEGGFGPVYMGTLDDGQQIAVKRLSKCSGQGQTEFKNEVKLIAKLQHRNLVRLLGCCIEGEEKILVYEYMPNGSLSSYIFDQTRGKSLEWSRRFNVISGIARGLLYLHQDSRLRIIHRDLKASNILLDCELNPKISDFGLARTFGGNQSEENTKRVVGTYGYMAPEYAFYGLYSVKSDVFSFGILLLEIISGKKNRGFDHSQEYWNLIGYAWKLWTEGRPLELVDPSLEGPHAHTQMFWCIHVGLLCVQQFPDDRPDMSSVVLMLNGESLLPEPKQPGLLIDSTPGESRPPSNKNEFSIYDFSITSLDAR